MYAFVVVAMSLDFWLAISRHASVGVIPMIAFSWTVGAVGTVVSIRLRPFFLRRADEIDRQLGCGDD